MNAARHAPIGPVLPRQLAEWNATDAPFPQESCLHELVAEQARRTPDSMVIDGAATLTFGELDERAERLAHHLQDLGVGADTLVGICLHRSLDMMVALLGVLKAGGAYVPLEPDQPPERLALMLGEARPPIVLTTANAAAILPPSTARVVHLDADRDVWMRCTPVTAPRSGPINLAYVLFTSGSTGTPRGVMIEHRSIVNQLTWRIRSVELTAADRIVLKTPLGFDGSLWQLFCPLLTGATLVLLAPRAERDPRRVASALGAQRITVTGFVPSMLEAFFSAARGQTFPQLRMVVAGGETLTPSLARRFFEYFGPGVELRNLYGPTETTVLVTSWTCTPDEAATVPIGRPVANTQLYVLDEQRRPVPRGQTGELWIGGVQVARGYLNQPELTADRFVANPFRPGERMYRSGDLGRHRADGALEFLGRRDGQVKIRGQRIELGEIEAALVAHPAVTQAAVLLRSGDGGEAEPRLVAHLVASPGETLTLTGVRAHLAERLTAAMVPSEFIEVAAMPVTSIGKIDRRALPSTAGRTLTDTTDTDDTEPRTVTERQIAAIWARALDVRSIGIDQDFFAMGGHSLLAARVIERMERELEVEIPIGSFFGADVTVARIAEVVTSVRAGATANDDTVAVQPDAMSPTLFFVHPDESAMLTLRHFVGALGDGRQVVGLLPERVRRRFDRSRSLEDLAAAIVAAIREAQPDGSYCIAGYSFGGLLAYEAAGQLRRAGEDVAWLGLVDCATPASGRPAMRRHLSLAQRARRQRQRGWREAARVTANAIQREGWAVLGRLGLLHANRDYDWRGAMHLSRRYVCKPHDSPVHLFFATDDPRVYATPARGWDQLHRGPLQLHLVPGDHRTAMQEPNVSVLVGEVSGSLPVLPPSDHWPQRPAR